MSRSTRRNSASPIRKRRAILPGESRNSSTPLFMPSARASVVLASLAVILTAAPGAAEWRRLDSPNFTVVGDTSARELRDLAIKFEGFRETLGRAIGVRAT